jgi:D-3-phosphoglycerate dehydrogenase
MSQNIPLILIPDDLPEECVEMVRQANFDATFDPAMDVQRLYQEISRYHGIIIRSRVKLTAELIDQAEQLQVIVRSGAGVDNIDLTAAKSNNIRVMNVPGANSVSVAELVIGMMLALYRHLFAATKSMKAGRWEKKQFKGHELNGKIFGLIGYGRIAREVAKRATAFDMKIITTDPYIDSLDTDPYAAQKVELSELLQSADVISIHVPLDKTTKNMISKKELALCKQEAILIHCARGGIVDEIALYQSLKQHQLAGAALDVYQTEPPGETDLLKLPNVIATPHIGASTVEAQIRTAENAARQLIDFFKTGKLQNVVV